MKQGWKRRGRDREKGKESRRRSSMDVCCNVGPKLILVSFLTECMNCTTFTDMNSRINAIETKVKRIRLQPTNNLIWSVCAQITSYKALVPDQGVRRGRFIPAESQRFTRRLNRQWGGRTPTHAYWTANLPAARYTSRKTCFLKYVEEMFVDMLMLIWINQQ